MLHRDLFGNHQPTDRICFERLIPLSEEELTIKVGSDWSEISFEDYEISFRNVEGRYPNWRAVVPKSNNLELKTDTKLLLGAIKRTSVFSSKVSCLIKLSARYDKLVVSAQDLDYSTSAEETIPVEFGEREFIIGVKATLIQDMISCIDGDRSILLSALPVPLFSLPQRSKPRAKNLPIY